MSPNGAVVPPAQGEALGKLCEMHSFGPKGQRFSSAYANDWPFGPTDAHYFGTISQGFALGWANGWAFGPEVWPLKGP